MGLESCFSFLFRFLSLHLNPWNSLSVCLSLGTSLQISSFFKWVSSLFVRPYVWLGQSSNCIRSPKKNSKLQWARARAFEVMHELLRARPQTLLRSVCCFLSSILLFCYCIVQQNCLIIIAAWTYSTKKTAWIHNLHQMLCMFNFFLFWMSYVKCYSISRSTMNVF